MEFAIKQTNGYYESITFNTDVIQTQGKSNIMLMAKIEENDFTKVQSIPNKNTVTKIDYPSTVTLVLRSTQPFTYTINGMVNKYSNKYKIEDFLYNISYGNIDYDYAYEHFVPAEIGGCSAIRNGNFFGRNFDWKYNNQVQFVVNTPTSFDRYAVIGISGNVPGIVKTNVDNDEIVIGGVDMFKMLPFYLLDGINEKGLFCTHNVVPLDNSTTPTLEVIAKIEERDRVCASMLPRFILDRFSTAKQALDYLIDYITVYFSEEMINVDYQSHFLIGDQSGTYVVEFIDNEIVVLSANYMTNFQISDVEFNEDSTVKYPPTAYGVNPLGFGLERWDIIAANYRTARTLDGMRELLGDIRYSNTYDETNFLKSELCAYPDDDGDVITLDTPIENCMTAIEELVDHYNNRTRSDTSEWIPWITCHSSIYDINHRRLYVINQEGEISGKEFVFDLVV